MALVCCYREISMKRLLYSMVIIVSMTLIHSCTAMNELRDNVGGFLGGTCERVDPDTLKPASRLAITAFEMEKAGMLEAFPYVYISPKVKDLRNTTDYSSFKPINVVVLSLNENPDGSFSQDMICESADRLGRIDVSCNRIVFAVRNPDKKEAAKLAKEILKAAEIVGTCDSEVRQEFKEAYREYQKENGLVVDGALGKNTARSMAETTPIIDVREMKSHIVYPEKPKSMIFVLAYDAVAAAPGKYNKGYKSLDAVKRSALSPREFKRLAVPGKKFVVFVYFLDRVSPDRAIRICVAPSEKRQTGELSPAKYAEPEAWPVITEILSVDEATETEKLFVNVFVKGTYTYTCVASSQIM